MRPSFSATSLALLPLLSTPALADHGECLFAKVRKHPPLPLIVAASSQYFEGAGDELREAGVYIDEALGELLAPLTQWGPAGAYDAEASDESDIGSGRSFGLGRVAALTSGASLV